MTHSPRASAFSPCLVTQKAPISEPWAGRENETGQDLPGDRNTVLSPLSAQYPQQLDIVSLKEWTLGEQALTMCTKSCASPEKGSSLSRGETTENVQLGP